MRGTGFLSRSYQLRAVRWAPRTCRRCGASSVRGHKSRNRVREKGFTGAPSSTVHSSSPGARRWCAVAAVAAPGAAGGCRHGRRGLPCRVPRRSAS